jgi:pilus assembly protein Flp/PilA
MMMKNLMQKIQSFWREEDGLVAIEYGLMAVFIALAIAIGANALGVGLNTMFENIAACFASPPGAACPVDLP